MSDFDLTHHAWTRYSDHYPAATEADVLREVEAAEEINRSVGDVLRGRFAPAKHDTTVYRLHRQRTGMFLVDGPVVVTYFRFEISQHRQAVRMYGEGEPVDECVPWAWLVRLESEDTTDDDSEPPALAAECNPPAESPPTGHTGRTTILGVPIEDIHLSAGAGKRWRGKLILREALRNIELVPPAQADAPHQRSIYYGRVLEPAFMVRAPDGSWVGIYLDQGAVRVMVPTSVAGSSPTTPVVGRTTILGVFVEDVRLSAGAGRHWGGKLKLREALRTVDLVPQLEVKTKYKCSVDFGGRVLEPTLMFQAPDESWVGVYEDEGNVRVMVPTPTLQDVETTKAALPTTPTAPKSAENNEDAPIINRETLHPLTGGRVADIRVAGPVLEAFYGRPTLSGGEVSKARQAIRTESLTADAEPDGDDRWVLQLKLPKGPMKVLLVQRPPVALDEEPEWWLLHCEPYEPRADHVVLAQLLRRAGWTVFAPVWVDASAQEAS